MQKENMYVRYKKYRNLIVTLLRQSKAMLFFEENNNNIKKTWNGIRSIVNISKKNRSSPTKVKTRNGETDSPHLIAQALATILLMSDQT